MSFELSPNFSRNFSKPQTLKFLQETEPLHREKAIYDNSHLPNSRAYLVEARNFFDSQGLYIG